MSIPNYVRPQHTIRQLLDQTADATVSRISAIIVGPQYTLARYGVRELPAVTFDASAFVVPWQYVDDDGVTQTATGANVDLPTAKLYAEDLEYTVLPADTVAALVVTVPLAVAVAECDGEPQDTEYAVGLFTDDEPDIREHVDAAWNKALSL
jgi:hypothetical protein